MFRRLHDWIDDRTGHGAIVHDALYELIPSGARFRYITGSMLVFAFVTQVITGLFLWMAYSPSSQTAYESVYYIQHHMTGGWLLRGIHHFMAQAMVVVMALHLLQVVWDGAYRAPREFNHWLGLGLLQIVLGLGLTGYLLPWDQKGYWATNVATNLATLVPMVGKDLQQLAVGGSAYGHHTLTRFFAMHAGVLPIALVVVLAAHIALFRRHGITAKVTPGRPDDYFWPRQVLFDALGCFVLLVIVLLLVVHFDVGGVFSRSLPESHRGAELGAPADPAEQYSAARPEWYYLFLFQLLKYFPGSSEVIGALVIPGVVMTIFLLMPFIGYFQIGHRFNQAFTVLVLLAAVVLTGIALSEDYFVYVANRMKWTPDEDGKPRHPAWLFTTKRVNAKGETETVDTFDRKLAASREFLAAREAAEHDALRTEELINRREALPTGGLSDVRLIPRQGAVSLLRNDPLSRGPRLFGQHCASCHVYFDPTGKSPWTFATLLQAPQVGPGGKVRRDVMDSVSYGNAGPPGGAPNLFGFATRGWIKGLLNKDQITAVSTFAAQPSPDAKIAADADHPDNYKRPIYAPYFGNTNLKGGRMAAWVAQHAEMLKDDPAKPDDDVDAIAAALSAQAQLPTQHEADTKDAELIRRGIGLIQQNCARGCHKFGDRGQLGLAPDLTGYGSYEWMLGLVSDPTHLRFYRMENDRMPSFAKDLDHPERNNLSVRELSLIIDWLRGQYYRPTDDAPILPHTEEQADEAVRLARTTASPWNSLVGASPPPPESEKTKAERLFAANCAACHSRTDEYGRGIAARDPSASNLFGFGSRAWLAGLLDPAKIKGDQYFGQTRHIEGQMVEFVSDNMAKLDDADKAKVQAIITTLAAEAALPAEAEANKKAQEGGAGEKGRKALTEAFETAACVDCHKYRDNGDVGAAPDLTGWASKDWLVRFITDPAHDYFYRATNDRMPSFGTSGPGPRQSLLTPDEIDLLARWLRGEVGEATKP